VLGLVGCASSERTEWTNANEPVQLSDESIRQLKIEADDSNPVAAYKLYTFYIFDKDSVSEAIHWLRLSAKEGYPMAEYNLGKILSESSSPDDRKESGVWLERARKHGVVTPTK
jgi:TPR repeat protein